jgi:hypothetical protein
MPPGRPAFGKAKAQLDGPDGFRQLFNNNPGALRHSRRALGGDFEQHDPLVQHAIVFQIEGERRWHEITLGCQVNGRAGHSNRRTRLVE